MPTRMVMIYILYLPVAKLDAMVVNLDVRCEEVAHFTSKSATSYPEMCHFFDENLKLCNEKIKVWNEKVKEFLFYISL